jgi:hypothetical protein
MKSLKYTLGMLAAGLVLTSGCDNKQILERGDYNQDGIEDTITGNPNGHAKTIHVSNGKDYTEYNIKRHVNSNGGIICLFTDEIGNSYVSNGKTFVYAPKWNGTIPLNQRDAPTEIDSEETMFDAFKEKK